MKEFVVSALISLPDISNSTKPSDLPLADMLPGVLRMTTECGSIALARSAGELRKTLQDAYKAINCMRHPELLDILPALKDGDSYGAAR
jgi:hypothetical protein